MKAPASEQRTLLRVQELDTRITQLAHRLRTLPQLAQLAELDAADAASMRERAEALGVVEDARSELRRIENDVELVQARIAKDTAREAGDVSAKEAAALETELAALRIRLSNLEDVELVVMQRVEDAERALSEVDGRVGERADARAVLSAERDAAATEIEQELGEANGDRRALAGTLDPKLIELYEKRRAKTGGIGAALLQHKMCGACNMNLTGNDLERIRALAEDEVAECPECDAIMVRTEESGL